MRRPALAAVIKAALVKIWTTRGATLIRPFVFRSDASGQCGDAADAVPAGKRLVIQHLTANGNVPSGAKVSTLAVLIPGMTRRLNLFAQITGPSLVNNTKINLSGMKSALCMWKRGRRRA